MSEKVQGKVHTHKEILIILSGLMTGMLLAALDQTIVSAALKSIVEEFNGLEHYTWVVTAYL
ncbi:MAG: MFS transporter, partial [Actinobacteria bacterium]|nr:MFS transporter [Actinomycetota bacterium]